MTLIDIAQDTKTAAGVAAVTVSTGVGRWLDWIPDDIGKLATLVGVILSVVIIIMQVRKGHLERAVLKAQLKKLKTS